VETQILAPRCPDGLTGITVYGTMLLPTSFLRSKSTDLAKNATGAHWKSWGFAAIEGDSAKQ